mmetsp:Transcript_29374/g.68117  ORF Transcript_29374/g.68117 Transcript_29374/m.68117 type:complete len:435 (+) Transcript_29374:29-1333(+)
MAQGPQTPMKKAWDSQHTAITEEFIRRIPKTDLHLHLDGSLRIGTILELAQKDGIELPGTTVEELKEKVFKEKYDSLVEYLEGFKWTCAVMQKPENVERISYELAVDNFKEGVRYFETRFAPQLHANDGFKTIDVVRAVNRGLERAKAEFNALPEVVDGSAPSYEYGMILIAMRAFDENTSQYYAKLMEVHSHLHSKKLYELASSSLARVAVACRDEGLPVVGFDIAGPEHGFPAETHREAYEYVHKHFLKKTVHAGEAYGPDSIYQALTDLHADRIGHGCLLFRSDLVTGHKNPEKFVAHMVERISASRIPMECCLSSNTQTTPELSDLTIHPMKEMLKHKMSICICTDNRLVSDTTVTRELELAVKAFQLTPKQLKDITLAGFKGAFFPQPYVQKRAYVRSVIDYYERLEVELLGPSSASTAGVLNFDKIHV